MLTGLTSLRSGVRSCDIEALDERVVRHAVSRPNGAVVVGQLRLSEGVSVILCDVCTQLIWRYASFRCSPARFALNGLNLGLSARAVATMFGRRDGQSLDLLLESHGLPRFRSLRDGYFLYHLKIQSDRLGSVSAFAAERGMNPSIWYRYLRLTHGMGARQLVEYRPTDVIRHVVTRWTFERPYLIVWAVRDWEVPGSALPEFRGEYADRLTGLHDVD
jgi:hypothetical protein